MPRILIPLRPILGVLQIGIKSQGYREPDTIMSRFWHSTVTFTVSYDEDELYNGVTGSRGFLFMRDHLITDYVPGPEVPELAPPITYLCTFVPELCLPGVLTVDDEPYYSTHLLSNPYHHTSSLPSSTHYPLPHRISPTYVEGSLGSRAAGIRRRDALPSHVHDTEIPEMWLPLRKRGRLRRRLCLERLGYGIRIHGYDLIGAIQEIAPNHLEGVNQARVNTLESDSPFHRRTAILMEEEARLSRAAWAQSMDACDQTHSEGILLRTTVMTQQSEIVELRAADQRRQTVLSELLKADHRRQRHLVETLKIATFRSYCPVKTRIRGNGSRRSSQGFAVGVAGQNPDNNLGRDVPIVKNFPEVFPEDLPGLPPTRQVEFHIDLVPGAAPVARAPYRLAPSGNEEWRIN
ncbi:hypothetical protein Tco_1079304 [Tanacetum coccineum]|uniref:Reverse transcriptase domain-containing protein n=1 Tax=Tanacetum coccineum TaxID=301880 RepID=A0ABQ5HRN8_9ASTR